MRVEYRLTCNQLGMAEYQRRFVIRTVDGCIEGGWIAVVFGSSFWILVYRWKFGK
jgi:hypothetical protein